MKELRIPGFLWVLLISLAIWAIETFVPTGYQMYAETAVVVLMGVAKAAKLNDSQIEELLKILRSLQTQVPAQESAFVEPEIAKAEPSKITTWLVG